jgi:hypothetical protein
VSVHRHDDFDDPDDRAERRAEAFRDTLDELDPEERASYERARSERLRLQRIGRGREIAQRRARERAFEPYDPYDW